MPPYFRRRVTDIVPLHWLAEPKLAERAKAGGEYRARTGDLLLAKQALSQLS
jgi:hypothetical protein